MNEPLDLGNQRDVQKRNKAIRIERTKVDEAFRWIMSDERGRRFVAQQLRDSEALAPRVTRDAGMAMFNEGRRAHGLGLIHEISRLCPQHLANVIVLSQAVPALPPGETDGPDA